MSNKDQSYQPGWGEKHHHHHHSHEYSRNNERYSNGWAGWLKTRDRSAYYGLLVIVAVGFLAGAYWLFNMIAQEIREMPKDDPTTEMDVDVLRIHKAEEQDARLFADSISQEYNLDSIKRTVQIETRPVYRPPRRENTWYITQREWKSIIKNYGIWKRMRDKEGEEDEKDELRYKKTEE